MSTVLLLNAACSSGSSTTASDTNSTGGATTNRSAAPRPAAARRPLAGFAERGFRFRIGEVFSAWFCGLAATTDATREQGLMDQTDLRGYDAMLFEWPTDASLGFWMKDTLIPLDIAWYDGGGNEVDRAQMEPCPADQTDCPISQPQSAYRIALEADFGGLEAMGATANRGAVLEVAATCRN